MAYTTTQFRWKIERIAANLGRMTSAADVPGLVREVLNGEAQEVLLAVYLSTQLEVIGYSEVTRGTLDASLVHPRETYRGALLANAASLVIAHNHPSGDPAPSSEDRQVTRAMAAAGVVMGIDLLDHIIVGEDSYLSFRESGWM